MLLKSLDDLYDELIPAGLLDPEGFKLRAVRFIVELSADGRCEGITDTGEPGADRSVPEIGRSGSKPQALPCTDNAQFVLGVPKSNKVGDLAAAESARDRYLDRLLEAVAAVESNDQVAAAQLRTIHRFLSDRVKAIGEFARRDVTFEFDAKGDSKAASARVAFRVGGIDPTDSSGFRTWWATVVSADLGSGEHGTCQATGRYGPLARKMPGVAVKPGTPQALISANFAAAGRYGAQQSSGSHIGVATAIRSHQALNWLLADRHHHRRAGELTFVWWLEGQVEFDGFDIMLNPQPDDVLSVLRAPWSGRPGMSPSHQFRLLALSLTEARVVVRMDHVSSLGEIEERTRRWLELVAQTRSDGSEWWPAIWNLAESALLPGDGAARKARKDRAIDALARAALTGQPLPRWLLSGAVDRCRAQPPSKLSARELGARYALLNLYRRLQEVAMPDAESRGTLCGRMLAQLESAQYAALGDLNRTVVDRYYGAASVTPERVFPGLLRDLNAHLNKAGRRQKGAQVRISKRVGELARLVLDAGGFPATFALEEQADFALGYWDERQSRFRRADESSPDSNDPNDIKDLELSEEGE